MARAAFGAAVGEHGLDHLEVGDGLAELFALSRVTHALLDQALSNADAHRSDMQSAAIQHLHGDAEALALFAEPVLDRYADIVEMDVVDMGALLAHFLFGLADGDTGQIARHQKR
jgi:hypothetical protein